MATRSFSRRAPELIPDGIAGEALTSPVPVFLDDVSGTGKYFKATSDAVGNLADGFAVTDTAAEDDEVEVQIARGSLVADFPASTFTTKGSIVYLSQTTAGGMIEGVRPSEPGKPVFVLGVVESSTSLRLVLETINDAFVDVSGHEILDTLVHSVSESCYYESTYTGVILQSEIFWKPQISAPKDNGKIREILYTYAHGTAAILPTTVVIKQYAADGVTVVPTIGTLTFTLNYNGGGNGVFVDSVNMVKS